MQMNKVVRRTAATACLASLCLAGCSDFDWNWWDSSNKNNSTQPDRRASTARKDTDTKTAARPSNPSSARPADDGAKSDDPQAREVDERVSRYVQDMNARYDSSYQGGQLASKIDRQSDPDRPNRIRQTVAKARSSSDPYQPEWAPSSEEQGTGRTTEQTPHARDESRSPEPAAKAPARDELEPEPTAEKPTKPIESKPDAIADESSVNQPRKADADEGPGAKPATESVSDTSKHPARPPVLAEISVEPIGTDRAEPGPASSAEPQKRRDQEAPSATDDPDAWRPNTRTSQKGETEPASELTPPESSESQRIIANAPPQTAAPRIDPIETRIAEQEAVVAREPNNIEEQFRLRLLYLVAGMDDKAQAPTPGINEDVQRIMAGQIQSLLAARSAAERDPAQWANRQLESVESLRDLVRAKADLRVPRVELCSSIEGFGRYEPIRPAQFMVGGKNLVVLYIEVDNFRSDVTESGLYRTLLSVRLSLLSSDGGEELWSRRDENIEDLARQKRTDFYLTIGPLAIPKTLAPGEYVIKVEVEDVLAGKINGGDVRFKMVP